MPKRVFVGKPGEHFFRGPDNGFVEAVPGETYEVSDETAAAFPNRFRPEGSAATVSELGSLRAQVDAANARATAAEDALAVEKAAHEETRRKLDGGGGADAGAATGGKKK